MRRFHLVALLVLAHICITEGSVRAAPAEGSTITPFTPAVAPVKRKAAVRSTLAVLLGVDLSWAKSQLELLLPQRFYREQGREVAPGISLDVEITRGELDLRVSADRANVSTDLLLDLDVRTKWGSFAGRLGKCRAVVAVELALSLELNQQGQLAAPVVNARMREPCRLSGFDLTPILLHEIEQRLGQSREQAQLQLAQVNSQLAKIAQDFAGQVSQPTSDCLRFVPDKVLQGPVQVDAGVASTWLALSGVAAHACTSPSPTTLSVEKLESAAQFSFAASQRISLTDFGQALTQHLQGAGTKAKLLGLRTARHDNRDLLAMRVHDQRGTHWILAHVVMVQDTVQLRVLKSKTQRVSEQLQAGLASFSWQCDHKATDALSDRLASTARESSMLLGSSLELKNQRLLALSQLTSRTDVLLDPDAVIVVRRHDQLQQAQ